LNYGRCDSRPAATRLEDSFNWANSIEFNGNMLNSNVGVPSKFIFRVTFNGQNNASNSTNTPSSVSNSATYSSIFSTNTTTRALPTANTTFAVNTTQSTTSFTPNTTVAVNTTQSTTRTTTRTTTTTTTAAGKELDFFLVKNIGDWQGM
jgi:hypothetical protein